MKRLVETLLVCGVACLMGAAAAQETATDRAPDQTEEAAPEQPAEGERAVADEAPAAAPAAPAKTGRAGNTPVNAEEAAEVTTESLAKPRPAHVFPVPPSLEPPDRIIFSHAMHVEDLGTECETCHAEVADATTIKATEPPEMAVCGQCHDVEDNCGMCHTNADEPTAEVDSWVKEAVFSHKSHMERDDIECRTCHPGAYTSGETADRLTPRMATCTTCHKAEMDRLACMKCHTNLEMLAEGPTEVAVHGANFYALHDAWAIGSSALCAQCHEQRFCADCHARTNPVKPSLAFPERVDRKLVHRGDFLGRHALEAAAQPGRCQTCHGQTFCSGCHDQVLGARPTTFTRSPHPPGYVTAGGEGYHGTDARVNPMACASCHDRGAASNCVECHRVGGIGPNPHPPGWDRKEEDRTRSGTCTPCHL